MCVNETVFANGSVSAIQPRRRRDNIYLEIPFYILSLFESLLYCVLKFFEKYFSSLLISGACMLLKRASPSVGFNRDVHCVLVSLSLSLSLCCSSLLCLLKEVVISISGTPFSSPFHF